MNALHSPGFAAGLLGTCLVGSAAAAELTSAALPLRRDPAAGSDWSIWLPLFVMLFLSALAIGYVVWQKGVAALVGGLGRRNGNAMPPLVRLSSQALTPQASVHVLQWQGDEFLVACTAQQVVLLARKGAVTAGSTTP